MEAGHFWARNQLDKLSVDAIKKDFSIDDIKAALEQEAVKPPIKEPNEEEDFPEDIMGAISQHRPATGANSGLRQILQIAQTEAAGGSGQCSICMDVPEDPVMTNCRHVFCQGRCFRGLSSCSTVLMKLG